MLHEIIKIKIQLSKSIKIVQLLENSVHLKQFSGPESYREFRETAPRSLNNITQQLKTLTASLKRQNNANNSKFNQPPYFLKSLNCSLSTSSTLRKSGKILVTKAPPYNHRTPPMTLKKQTTTSTTKTATATITRQTERKQLTTKVFSK